MSSPAVSVVMGVYNGADYLAESIDSVLAQTERDFEFIIVNDGSTDPRIGEILAEYALRDQRIHVITNANEGLTKALIDGCAAARGMYIARIDVGDVMTPDRLRRQKAVVDVQPDAVLVTCWTEYRSPCWEYLYTTKGKTAEYGKEYWVNNVLPDLDEKNMLAGPTSHPSTMFRADAYRNAGGYRTQFYYGQDWDLWYRLAELGVFAGIQCVLYRCRIFPEGISMQNAERQRQIHACSRGAFLARRRGEDEILFLERAATIRPKSDVRYFDARISKRQRLAAGYYFVGEALRRNGAVRSRHYLTRALMQAPWYPKLWVRLIQSLISVRSDHKGTEKPRRTN